MDAVPLRLIVLLGAGWISNAPGATNSWIGNSGDWNTPANWSSGALPGPGDDIIIDVPGEIIVTFPSGMARVATLQCSETLVLSGGSLTATNTIHLNASLVISGGTLSKTVVAAGTSGQPLIVATATGGVIDGVTLDAPLTVRGTAHLVITNGLVLNSVLTLGGTNGNFDYGRATFHGDQAVSGTGEVVLDNAGSLLGPASGSRLTIAPEIRTRGRNGQVGGTGGVIVNEGTLVSEMPGGRIQIAGSFTNLGQIVVRSGTWLSFQGGTWGNLSTIVVTDGILDSGPGPWSNSGAINATNSTINLGGTFSLASLGTLNRSGGIVYVIGTLDNRGTTFTLDHTTGPWSLAGGTVQGGTVAGTVGLGVSGSIPGCLDGVTLDAPLMVRGTANLVITNGLVLNSVLTIGGTNGQFDYGRMLCARSQHITGRGEIRLVAGGVYINNGPSGLATGTGIGSTLVLGPDLTIHGHGSVLNPNGGVIINHGDILSDLPGGFLRIGYGSGSFTNYGRLAATVAGAAFQMIGSDNFSAGDVDAVSGTTVEFKGTLQFDGSARLRTQPGATLEVTGSILGNAPIPVAFEPHGTTVLNGNGTSSAPQLIEVMSQDRGRNQIGFVSNFEFGALVVAGNTFVRLVDLRDNSAGTDPEALYVNSLIVSTGTTVDVAGLRLYTRLASVGGTITGGEVLYIPDSGPLAVRTLTGGALSAPGEFDEWTFFGREDQAMTLILEPGGATVPNPKLNFVEVRVLAPDGVVLDRGTNTVAGEAVVFPQVLLPVDGVYRVQVRTPADQSALVGNYQISLWEVRNDTAALGLSEIVHGRIESPYSTDRWTFAAAAGQHVRFDLVNVTAPSVRFELRGPNGWTGFSNLFNDSEPMILPASGDYVLTAKGTGGARDVAYALQLAETVQTDLPFGSIFTGEFVSGGHSFLFRISVTNSWPVRFVVSNAGVGNRIGLYLAKGRLPTRGAFEYESQSSPGSLPDMLIPNLPPGDYYLLVYGEYIPSPGAFSLHALNAGVFIERVTPKRTGGLLPFRLTITGAGFEFGGLVDLVDGNGEVAAVSFARVDSWTQLTAPFLAHSVPPGRYSVRIRQNDGDTVTLADAFEMLTPGTPELRTRVIVPDVLGRHSLATIFVEYENVGTASMPAPLLQLRSADPDDSDKPLLTLKPHRLSDGFWTSTLPEGFGHSVTLLASGEQSGMLHPGESRRVPVYYAGLLQPYDLTDSRFEFGVASVDVTDTRPMNWEGISYGFVRKRVILPPGAVKSGGGGGGVTAIANPPPIPLIPVHARWREGKPPSSNEIRELWLTSTNPTERLTLEARFDEPGVLQLRPDSIPEAAWSGILTNLRASVGETLGDWVRVLGENASYLARHGQPNANIDDLWRFEVLQASGLGPVPVLDAVTDASMVVPGVGLSLSRTFPNSIPGRHVRGPFGYGWTLSWDQKLIEHTNGLIEIGACCGGTRRRYKPDTRTPGHYFSMPGDTASLRKVGDGAFELRDPNGTVTRFAASGLLDAVEDPNGNRVMAGYDGSSRLQSLMHSSGAGLSISYNAAGLIGSIHDSTGRTNRYAYDGAGGNYLETVTTHDGMSTRYAYVTSGDARVNHALTSIEHGGTIQHFTYDARGRLESTYRAANEQFVQFSYDSDGTVFVADSLGTNQLYYNESGLLAKVVDPLGQITSSEFDNDFRLKKLVLLTGENQSFAWTKTGNLTSLTDELGHSTSFNYDPAFNRLASFTDAKLNTTRYTYDARGNLLSTIYPNQSVERFANYTGAGFPLTYINRRGQPLTYEYNATGQITNQVFADGHSIQFTYDARGNLASTIDGAKVTIYPYAPASDGDRLKRVTYPNGRFLDYTYDNFGRRIQMTDQDGFATKYEYDSAGRLWKLRDETNTLLVTYSYDPSGRLSRIDKGNGTFTTYQYDAAGQLLSLQNHRNAATLNSRFDYTYDRRGRRTSMSTLDGDWTYGYDAIGQLTRAVFDSTNPQIPDQDLTYEYDALGNRVWTIENGVTNIYVANNLNQYTSVAGTNHQYDADGNLTFDGVNTYEWDQQSRLVRVTGPNGATEYEYDAFGNQTATVSNGQRTEFQLDPSSLVAVAVEHDASGNPSARNIQGVGIIGRRTLAGSLIFYDFDAIGSTVGMTGTSGSLANRYVYRPFGSRLQAVENIFNLFQFVGQHGVRFEGDDQYWMGFRVYSSSVGRFASADPFRISMPTMYGYAANQPATLIDREGLFPGDPSAVYDAGKQFGCDLAGPGDFDTYGNPAKAFQEHVASRQRLGASGPVFGRSILENIGHTFRLRPKFSIRSWYNFLRTLNTARKLGGAGAAISGVGVGGANCNPPPNEDPPVPNLPPNSETETETANSTDPNEKLGPIGFGSANFLAPGASLPYRIKFENFGSGSVDENGAPFPSQVWASAPAQEVEITDALSPALDWSTLRFTGFGFGDTLRAMEPPRSFFQTILPVTIDGRSFEVHFEASLNLATGRLRAVFRSIDPETSLPPDVLTGFLPPEDGTGRGQGFIEYTVEPRAGLPTGTQIRNVALISFDRQPTIATDQIDPLNPAAGNDPAKQALVTIDSGAPSSSVTALPAESGRAFVVQWSGQDDAGGSGLATYDIFVSSNSATFVPWFSNVTNTAALFVGELGKSYAFYSIARDNVGNVELASVVPETQTRVIPTAPVIVGITNRLADVGAGLIISNSVQGSPTGSFLWSLAGAPSGVTINPTNGLLRWTPSCAQGSTTNLISIWVTDAVRTNIHDLMTFAVAVKECVSPQLGRLVLRSGDTGRLPVNLVTSVELTNLVTLVSLPTNRFINLGVESLATQICLATIQSTNSFPVIPGDGLATAGRELHVLSFGACSNLSLIGTQQIAWLVLTAATNPPSAFVPVEIGPSIGIQPGAIRSTNYVTQRGTVIVVDQEPLLEAVRSTNRQIQVILFAPTGVTNIVQSTRDLPSLGTLGAWELWREAVPTNVTVPFPPFAPTNQHRFYRAVRP